MKVFYGLEKGRKARGDAFSSPEPVVAWSRGFETRGSGSSRYQMSENFWHPITHVQKLQISLLMLITDFCPSPLILVPRATRLNFPDHVTKKRRALGTRMLTASLGKKCYFLSSLQRVASLGCFENTDFTQLGFTDNLESKGEDINKNQPKTLLGFKTETVNWPIIVWV